MWVLGSVLPLGKLVQVRKAGWTSFQILHFPDPRRLSPDLLLHVLLLVAGPRLLLRCDTPLLLHRRQPLLLLCCWLLLCLLLRLLRLMCMQRRGPPRGLRGRWELAGAAPTARRH
jgi:hypothetical protein